MDIIVEETAAVEEHYRTVGTTWGCVGSHNPRECLKARQIIHKLL